MRYGKLPEDLGLVDINPTEMLFHMYMPISLPGMTVAIIPDHLWAFRPLVNMARENDPQRFKDEYVYLTAKTLWVSGSYIGNRPGWHSDGFGTDDLNYIWADRAPTDFLHVVKHQYDWMDGDDFGVYFDDCQADACNRFYEFCDILAGRLGDQSAIKHFEDKHLLKLDPSVIHRSPVDFEEGMRSFAKVSISKDVYNLEGNASNPLLETGWEMKKRTVERNHPHKD